jgi:hypothetical protein
MAKYTASDTVILQAFFEGRELARINRQSVPIEELPVGIMSTRQPALILKDSRNTEWLYDLSSCLQDGARYLHFSIRVGPTFAVQGDCLLWDSEQMPADAFAKGSAKGIRFQPFYLPESPVDPAELVGRGLFFRGFHFSGTITPGNVSLLCICDSCRKSFRAQSFHAGFGNNCYFYCDKGPHTLIASSYLPDAPPVLGKVDLEMVRRFESKLPLCEKCGGEFRYYNSFRCPHCLAPYIDFKRYPHDREVEYYGNQLYGDTLQWFEPAPAT